GQHRAGRHLEDTGGLDQQRVTRQVVAGRVADGEGPPDDVFLAAGLLVNQADPVTDRVGAGLRGLVAHVVRAVDREGEGAGPAGVDRRAHRQAAGAGGDSRAAVRTGVAGADRLADSVGAAGCADGDGGRLAVDLVA